MDPASYGGLAGRLYGLPIAVEDRLGSEMAREAHHFIEVGEYELALEEIAGVIGLTGQLSLTRAWRHVRAGPPDENG